MAKETVVLCDPDLKDGTPLRRYLDLPKYIDLLRSQSLYFRRSDKFTDKFEGALTPAIREAIDSACMSGSTTENSDTFYRRCRMGTFVSCWTLGAKDNMALWQLYGGASTSVAVNTTISRLTAACIAASQSFRITRVRYIDHFENPDMVIGHYTDPLRFKHEAYDFEREVRVLLSQQNEWERNPEGLYVLLPDLSVLVTSIVVAPEAGDWFLDLIQDVTKRYGLRVPVRRSALTNLPS